MHSLGPGYGDAARPRNEKSESNSKEGRRGGREKRGFRGRGVEGTEERKEGGRREWKTGERDGRR